MTVRQLFAVLDNLHVLIRNRKERAAPHVLIGLDDQGRCLAIPVLPTDDPLIWRPVTAWECKPGEAAKLRQRRTIVEQPKRYSSLQEPLDDEERELMDPNAWDWENPVELSVAKHPGAVLPIRFAREEIVRLEDVARAEGLTPHEFIKRAALEAAKVARR